MNSHSYMRQKKFAVCQRLDTDHVVVLQTQSGDDIVFGTREQAQHFADKCCEQGEEVEVCEYFDGRSNAQVEEEGPRSGE